nr:TPA_asm: m114.5 sORF 1 [Murid betaherpesvirus 1]DBA07889.1 TPA_asm: m114.5 sORF 1 [Murid betaherpesvirus 1]
MCLSIHCRRAITVSFVDIEGDSVVG